MKKIFVLFSALLFIYSAAQVQEELDKTPFPVNGIKAIAEKVIYPPEAKEQGTEGKVLVKVIVDVKGNVVSTKVIEGIGNGCDEAACESIKKTKFSPAEKDGKNVQAEVVIPVKFKLCDKEKK